MSKIAAFIDFQGTLGGGGVDDIKSFSNNSQYIAVLDKFKKRDGIM